MKWSLHTSLNSSKPLKHREKLCVAESLTEFGASRTPGSGLMLAFLQLAAHVGSSAGTLVWRAACPCSSVPWSRAFAGNLRIQTCFCSWGLFANTLQEVKTLIYFFWLLVAIHIYLIQYLRNRIDQQYGLTEISHVGSNFCIEDLYCETKLNGEE